MSEKIVIIEDNTEVRENVNEILESSGYTVEAAENGRVGLEIIKRSRPDLIICDIMMPDMEGYELLQQLRSDKNIADTPFVFLTAKTSRDDLSKGMEMGADDYIIKPFTISELLKRVKIRLDKRKEIVERSKKEISDSSSQGGAPIQNELTEPLRTLTGIGKMIMTDHYHMEKSQVVEFVSLIHKAGLELEELVGETLSFYEVEDLKNNPEKLDSVSGEATDSKPMIEHIGTEEASDFHRENDLVISAVDAKVNIPEKYLSLILKNLINNAFKFSMSGSMVRIISGEEKGRLVISISDEGIGMTKEEIEKIGPYRKFNNDDSRKGLGLGLASAKQIVKLFNGTFTVSSNKGVGTLVRFRIPLA